MLSALRRLRRRTYCRARDRSLMSFAAASIALGPLVMAGCPDNVTRVGHVVLNLTCTGTGIQWSAHTTDFLPNEPIGYVWEIFYNGQRFANRHDGYHTDRYGGHFRLPNGFPQALDCGHGNYSMTIHVESLNNPTIWTEPDAKTVTC